MTVLPGVVPHAAGERLLPGAHSYKEAAALYACGLCCACHFTHIPS